MFILSAKVGKNKKRAVFACAKKRFKIKEKYAAPASLGDTSEEGGGCHHWERAQSLGSKYCPLLRVN